MEVTANNLPDYLTECARAGITSMIHGSPAIGKSNIVQQFADNNNLEMIDVRLSQSDPIDLGGVLTFNADRTKGELLPLAMFPVESDPLPAGKNGWVLFLDEITSAHLTVQAAAFKLTLDKKVGQFNLHKNVVIICAGNLTTDKAIVTKLSTPMQSRLAHFTLKINNPAWLVWAALAKIDHRIMSFIRFKPDILYRFDPDHNGDTYPSPRTWEFANRFIKQWTKIENEHIPLIASVIEEGPAREFFVFCKIYEELPSIEDIKADPQNVNIKNDPSNQYAISGLVAHHLKPENASSLMQFVARLPIEFQIITVKDATSKHKKLMAEPAVYAWTKKNAKEFSPITSNRAA